MTGHYSFLFVTIPVDQLQQKTTNKLLIQKTIPDNWWKQIPKNCNDSQSSPPKPMVLKTLFRLNRSRVKVPDCGHKLRSKE